uniref:Budded virus envelope/capsid protein 31 n=1 Tax=Helicoverpa armigera nucleopolyhedrovirus TaxID=51313 RepID=A0A482ET40_9ABAC|nr:hypothetical protein [Helicoverpa armigera nucleopolyhedrovirus]
MSSNETTTVLSPRLSIEPPFAITVYVDDNEVLAEEIILYPKSNYIVYKYRMNFDDRASNDEQIIFKRVNVRIDSGNCYVQGTFTDGRRHVAVVNAADKNSPITFDGFPDYDNDDSQTLPFVLRRLNQLKKTHKLTHAKDIARAMEQSSKLRVFVNEVALDSDTHSSKWYSHLWLKNSSSTASKTDHRLYETQLIDDVMSFSDLVKSDKLLEAIDETTVPHVVVKNKPIHVWAPVECRTGKRLCCIDLVFENEGGLLLSKNKTTNSS